MPEPSGVSAPDQDGSSSVSTRASRIAKDTAWSLAGQVLSTAANLVCIPLLIHNLGVERYGAIALASTLLGYFLLFDFGLGRVIVLTTSRALGEGRPGDVSALFWTSAMIMSAFGLAGTLGLFFLSQYLVRHFISVPPALLQETLLGYQILTLGLPLLILQSAFSSLLVSHQKFRDLSFIRLVMSLLTWLLPLIPLLWTRNIALTIAMMQMGRFVGLGLTLYFCHQHCPSLWKIKLLPWARTIPLLHAGGWVSLTNVLSPLMTYLDRLIISGTLSLTAVAWYSTASDIAAKIWLIPAALSVAITPPLSAAVGESSSKIGPLFRGGLQASLMILFPVCMIANILAPEVLALWINPVFSQAASLPFQILVAGVFVNSLSIMPFNLLQAADKLHLTSLLHMLELPVYLGSLYLLLARYGITGAAIAWSGRIILDAVLLFLLSRKTVSLSSIQIRSLVTQTFFSLLFLLLPGILNSLPQRLFLLLICPASLAFSWRGLDQTTRERLLSTFRRFLPQP